MYLLTDTQLLRHLDTVGRVSATREITFVTVSFFFLYTIRLMRGFCLKEKNVITKTCLYNFDPLKPHFYIVKLGFTGVCIIFLISAQKHRLWVLIRTASHNLCLEQKYENIRVFYLKVFSFWR